LKPNELIFKLPQFEIKDLPENEWKKVSEREFLLKLVESFYPITPALRDMFQGKDLITRNCIYRIKFV
jgi:hypothetical protein